ncbi:MAG: EamA family transporter [Gordonia sp. (in: high G+C Gram-positive bacteria)]
MSTRDRLLGLTVAALWGVNFIAIRYGLNHFPPFFFAALRFAVMAVPVIAFVRFPKVHLRWFLVYGVGFGVGQFALLFLAMNIGMPTGLASLVLQTSAPFTVLLGVAMLRERLTPAQILGIAVAVGGIAVIGVDQAGHSALGWGVLLPVALTVLAGLSWAFGNIGSRLAEPDDALRMTLWMSVVPPVPLYLLSLVIEGPSAGFHAVATLGSRSGLEALAGLAYVVVLATIVGSGLWTLLMQRYPASRVAPLSLLVPVAGISAAWLILGETPSALELCGAALVIAGCAAGVLAAPHKSTPEIDEESNDAVAQSI